MKNSEKPVSTQTKLLLLSKLQQQRINLFEHDFKGFCYWYFPDYFYNIPSQLHEDLFKSIQEAVDNGQEDSEVDAAPRGNAKSTIVSFALPIWAAVYGKKKYILIVSDTADQANDFLSNIKDAFEDNEKLIEDFGELQGDIWTTSNLILANGVRLQALGVGKKVRGRRYKQYRPDLIICDDLENDENIASPDQRRKTENWYFRALSKAGDSRTDKFFIGTILHYDSLLAKLLKNPVYKSRKYQAVINWSNSPLWDQWEKLITNLDDLDRVKTAKAFFEEHRDEMLAGTKVLWPQKEDYYNLMVQKVIDGPAAFSSEKQNEPLSDDERRFNPEWIQYYDQSEIVGKELNIVCAVDPSMGKVGGDYSAIVTLGEDANRKIYVLDADIEKRHPDVIIQAFINKYLTYKFKKAGVEQVQFQEYFKDALSERLIQEGIDITVKGIRTHSDKILRIESLQPDIKSGRIKFRRDQQKLIEQLVNFPSADHDDGPDALELAMGLFGRFSAIEEYYKRESNEKKINPQSFIQNPILRGSLERLQPVSGS